jgi:CubicO group peptidase (beta-lactamase class C family)
MPIRYPALAKSIPLTILLAFTVPFVRAQSSSELPADFSAKIDDLARSVLAQTGVPSASIAIVKDGHIAYTNAYGMARLQPPTRATPEMRYSIGSVSKQFTAAAILLLQQEGKLKLDDPVGKYLPNLTRASEVTIRMLLSHSSGYQDFWPEDYVMPPMMQPATPQYIMDTWAKKPLDFDPGTKWQYSNTNYVIAGRIVEQVSGQPLFRFLQQRNAVGLQQRRRETRRYRRPGLPAVRARSAASRPERGRRLDVCRRRTGHARPRLGSLEHQHDEPVVVVGGVL